MRPASAVLASLLACVVCACASAPADTLAREEPHAAAVPASARGAELYGRYCTGCHAGAVRTNLAQGGAPWLMHIQARVGMGAMPSLFSEPLTREDTREIVDYLDASRTPRARD
jgi:cytochrome c5